MGFNRLFVLMVAGIAIALSLLSGAFDGAAFAEAPAKIPLATFRKQSGELLRTEAIAKTAEAKFDAASALCDVYVVMRSDARYPASPMLQGDSARVRHRLLTISKRIQRKLKREDVERSPGLKSTIDSVINALIEADGDESSSSFQSASQTATSNLQAGGAVGDPGWQLVELIERIVRPDFWVSRGGPGSVCYFAMRRVLVVRATSDVHQQIKDLLRAIR